MHPARAQEFCGRAFSREEFLSLIQEIVETCGGVSRTELAHTVPSWRVKVRDRWIGWDF
jgi:hypothetical protein